MRVKRRIKARRTPWTPHHIDTLMGGLENTMGFGDPWNLNTSDERREEILATRPAAWWLFESKEPRRVTAGPGLFVMRDPEALPWAKRLSFGAPCVFSAEDETDPSDYESQATYLDRLGLLTAAERRAPLTPLSDGELVALAAEVDWLAACGLAAPANTVAAAVADAVPAAEPEANRAGDG
jgi:hypothetical protein